MVIIDRCRVLTDMNNPRQRLKMPLWIHGFDAICFLIAGLCMIAYVGKDKGGVPSWIPDWSLIPEHPVPIGLTAMFLGSVPQVLYAARVMSARRAQMLKGKSDEQ